MATNRAIAATSAAIATLLEAEALRDPRCPRCTVSLFQAEQLQKPAEGVVVSVYLYRVNLSVARRDRGLRGRRTAPTSPRSRSTCTTWSRAWSASADTSQRLLGWAASRSSTTRR